MSTRITAEFGIHELSLTQYYGGDDRGICIQITGYNCDRQIGYVGMTSEEALKIAQYLTKWAKRVRA